MEYRKLLQDGGHLVGGRIGAVLAGFISMMILTRILTTSEMGKYSLFLMIVNLALILGVNWFDTSIVRFGREEFVRQGNVSRSFWARAHLYVPSLAILLVAAFVFRDPISEYIGLSPQSLWLVVATFLLTGALNGLSLLYQCTDQLHRSAYTGLTQRLLLLVALLLFYFQVFTPGVWPVLIVVAWSYLLALSVNLIGFRLRLVRPYSFDRTAIRKIWNYSWPQLIGFTGLYAINYVDLYTIKRFLTIDDVGIYSVAYGGFSNLTSLIMMMNTIAMPFIVKFRTNRQPAMIAKYLRSIPLLTAGWAALALLGALLADWIVPLLFSAKYAPTVPSLQVLLVASIFYFVAIALLPVMNSFDLVMYTQAFNLIKAGVNIAADFILVPRLGIVGAAYGTLLSYVVGLILTVALVYLKRRTILQAEGLAA